VQSESGQVAVEWAALLLLIALALGAAVAASPSVDGRLFGGFVAHRLVCVVKGGCDDSDAELARIYGQRDAGLVRRSLPGFVFERGEQQVPVDWRSCRSVECASAPDDQDLDVHRTGNGGRVTVFTRLLRQGRRRYIQYWSYYPTSNTAFAGSDRLWERSAIAQSLGRLFLGSTNYPGWHRDDWEGVAIRVDRDGARAMRVTSHGHWQWCKHPICRGSWGPATGWTRVSKGSHAGHVPLIELPGRGLRERTTTPEGIRLVPLEGLDRRRYQRLDPDIAPPWLKDAYANPESPAS